MIYGSPFSLIQGYINAPPTWFVSIDQYISGSIKPSKTKILIIFIMYTDLVWTSFNEQLNIDLNCETHTKSTIWQNHVCPPCLGTRSRPEDNFQCFQCYEAERRLSTYQWSSSQLPPASPVGFRSRTWPVMVKKGGILSLVSPDVLSSFPLFSHWAMPYFRK